MTQDKEWECWTLCAEDIDIVAQRMGISPSVLKEKDYEEIARMFKDGLAWANEEWARIIEDALDDLFRNSRFS